MCRHYILNNCTADCVCVWVCVGVGCGAKDEKAVQFGFSHKAFIFWRFTTIALNASVHLHSGAVRDDHQRFDRKPRLLLFSTCLIRPVAQADGDWLRCPLRSSRTLSAGQWKSADCFLVLCALGVRGRAWPDGFCYCYCYWYATYTGGMRGFKCRAFTPHFGVQVWATRCSMQRRRIQSWNVLRQCLCVCESISYREFFAQIPPYIHCTWTLVENARS